MSEIDWSKAPEGATHWTCNDDVICQFLKRDDGKWFWWSDKYWVAYVQPDIADEINPCMLTERPSEVWKGIGLPPVGTVCEYYIDDDKWRQCEIVAHKDGYAVIWITAAHVFSSRSSGLLRPIRTQEQIEAEERERAIDEMYAIVRDGMYDKYALCSELYDAGFRKQGEAK